MADTVRWIGLTIRMSGYDPAIDVTSSSAGGADFPLSPETNRAVSSDLGTSRKAGVDASIGPGTCDRDSLTGALRRTTGRWGMTVDLVEMVRATAWRR
jgi:hypothetical protein